MDGFTNLLYKYLLKSNFFISFCAVLFFHAGTLLLNTNPLIEPELISALIFINTYLIYSVSQKQMLVSPLVFSSKNIFLIVIAITSIVLSLLILSFREILFLGHLGIISIFYNASSSNSRIIPFRALPLVKIFLIAYVWASVGSVFPFLLAENENSGNVWILFISQFLFILSITLPFDIRDYYRDRVNKLLTIPGLIGITNTKKLALILLWLSIFSFVFSFCSLIGNIVLGIISSFLIYFSSEKRKNYYYLLLVDGAIVVYYFMVKISA